MGYRSALEAAGAKVLDFEQFGSYQGTWIAHVELDGVRGFVSGSFGSCSYCDAFDAEFGYSYSDEPDESYDKRLKEFGMSYLEGFRSHQTMLNEAARDLSWDCEAEEMVAFVLAKAKEDGALVIPPAKKDEDDV